MKKLMIFPWNADTEILIDSIKNIKHYDGVVLSSFPEDEKSLINLQKQKKINCSTKFADCLEKVTDVLFVDADDVKNRGSYGYKDKIQMALDSEKDIYLSKRLLDRYIPCKESEKIHVLQEQFSGHITNNISLKEISIPVVSIMSMGKCNEKFKLQVKMWEAIRKKGYKVLPICSNPYGEVIGMKSLPAFLFSEEYSLPIKTLKFNQWVCNLQQNEEYDMILLGYPGGILSLNEIETNYFCEIPLIISNALVSDVGVVTVYDMFHKHNDLLKQMSELCLKKYNTVISDFVLSSNYYKTDYEAKKVNYYNRSKENGIEYEEEEHKNYSLISLNEEAEIQNMVNRILTKLQGNFYAV